MGTLRIDSIKVGFEEVKWNCNDESLTDKAYENSITEHKAILDAVKKRDFMKVTEALEDHLIKHFLPEERG